MGVTGAAPPPLLPLVEATESVAPLLPPVATPLPPTLGMVLEPPAAPPPVAPKVPAVSLEHAVTLPPSAISATALSGAK